MDGLAVYLQEERLFAQSLSVENSLDSYLDTLINSTSNAEI